MLLTGNEHTKQPRLEKDPIGSACSPILLLQTITIMWPSILYKYLDNKMFLNQIKSINVWLYMDITPGSSGLISYIVPQGNYPQAVCLVPQYTW